MPMGTEPVMQPQQGALPGTSMPPAPGAAPSQPQPYRQLKVEDALAYLDQVKMKFEKQPHIYNKVRLTCLRCAGSCALRQRPTSSARSRDCALPRRTTKHLRILPRDSGAAELDAPDLAARSSSTS